MNRTDRLWAIVLELQRHKSRRAEDLAAAFEVTRRTVYRDIQALSEAGVPIVAIPGQGYSLPEGYFLPPINLTSDEALMLVLGSDFMAQNFDAQYRAAALAAIQKIEAVLSDPMRREFRYLRENITFFSAIPPGETSRQDKLLKLRRAIINQRVAQFCYTKRFAQDTQPLRAVRKVEPYRLAHFAAEWYLMGYCYLREDIRVFRLSRIEDLQILDQPFHRPAEIKANWIEPNDNRKLIARVLFAPPATRWLHESYSFYITDVEKTEEGSLVTLKARHEDEILPWLLSWGADIRVLEPESLQAALSEKARGILRHYR